jgi:hypothetical protein
VFTMCYCDNNDHTILNDWKFQVVLDGVECSISLKGPTRFQGRGPLKSAERSDEAICTVYINPH